MEWAIRTAPGGSRAAVGEIEYNGEWMSERYVTVTVESPDPVDFEIGDWIEYRGERFELNYIPTAVKTAASGIKGDGFKYENIKLNSLGDELTRCDFLDIVPEDNTLHFTSLPKFSFYGSVRDLAGRIQANLDRAYGKGEWTVSVDSRFANTEEKNLTFDNKKTSDALATAYSEFGAAFIIKGRTVTIGAPALAAGHMFKHGKGEGLYEIERSAESDQAIVTRLRAYGSTRNIPHRYYNSLTGADGRKLIPDNMAARNLMLPGFPETTIDPFIVSANIGAIGVREGTVTFDGSNDLEEIYPSIEGMAAEQLRAAGVQCNSSGTLDTIEYSQTVDDDGTGTINGDKSELDATDATFDIHIKDIGFDINEHLTDETATVSFKTGMLSGRDFEIVECRPITGNVDQTLGYALTLNRVWDDDIKLWFPYSAYNAKSGDRFVLLGIRMPDVYIKAASQRLLNAAKEWLSKNDYARSVYSPKIDEIFMARQHDRAIVSQGTEISLHDTLSEGMQMLFTDDDLRIDGAVVIDKLIIREGGKPVPEYEVTLKEEKTVGALQKVQQQVDSIISGRLGNGGYTAQQIQQFINTYGKQLFLSRVSDDTAAGLLTLEKGWQTKGYDSSMTTGKGAGVMDES